MSLTAVMLRCRISPMLHFDNVSKRFDDVKALQPFNQEITPARTTVLIGPSGCGKSTILRLVVGLLKPDTGLIRFNDVVISPENVEELRRHMGYVIQEGGLFPHLTGRDNAVLMAEYLNWDKDRIQSRLGELTALVHLPVELLDRYPVELSGGQRQRISLIRALMLDPDLLLMDEPLGALDPMIRYELQQDLKKIFAGLNKTVLLVTHDLSEAAYFGDHILLMRDGTVVQQGTLQTLLEHPAEPFVEQFIRAQREPIRTVGELS